MSLALTTSNCTYKYRQQNRGAARVDYGYLWTTDLISIGIITIKRVAIYLDWILILKHCLQMDNSGNTNCDMPSKDIKRTATNNRFSSY
jgi:hypothetical protein